MSGFEVNKKFENELKEIIKEIYYDKSLKNAIVYIDKNHPTNTLNRTIEPLNNFYQYIWILQLI